VKLLTDPPPGLIPVSLKGAVLLLTEPEVLAGIRRGKTWRRRVARLQRAQTGLSGDVPARMGMSVADRLTSSLESLLEASLEGIEKPSVTDPGPSI
jgi:hypothetical protein